MRGVRNDDRRLLVSLCPMIRSHHHDAGQLTMRPGQRLHGKSLHAGDLAQQLIHVVENFQRSLHKFFSVL